MKWRDAWTIAVALAVGGATGFALSRHRQAESSKETRARPAAAISAGESKTHDTSPPSTDQQLAAILAEPAGGQQLVALDRFCANLDTADAQRLLREYPADGAKNAPLRARLLARWAEIDPGGAAVFALAIKDSDARGSALSDVLKVWIAQDAEAAESFVTAQPLTKTEDFLFTFAHQLAAFDPERALAFAAKIPPSREGQLGRAVFWMLARRDPVAATARAAALPAGRLREDAIDAAVGQWIKVDAPAAMAWVLRRPDTPVTFDQKLLDSAVRTWADRDPAAAARYVLELPKEKRGKYLLAGTIGSWAFRDAPAALRWAQALPPGEERAEALDRIAGYWANADPLAAVQLAAQNTTGEKRESRLESIGKQWAERDPAAALAWAQTQSGALREKLVPAALAKLAEDNPDAASAQLATLTEPALRREAIGQIASQLARHAPQDAVRWMLDLPAGDASDSALKQVIATGAGHDPTAMGNLLNELGQHPRRETIVAAFVESAGWNFPEDALAWAATLTDAEQRKKMTRETVRRFAWYDSESAQAWVMSQQIDPAEQKVLLEVVEKTTRRR